MRFFGLISLAASYLFTLWAGAILSDKILHKEEIEPWIPIAMATVFGLLSFLFMHTASYEDGKDTGKKEGKKKFKGRHLNSTNLKIGKQYKTISAEKSGKCWHCILLHINSKKKLFFVFSAKPPKDFVATQKADKTILLSATEEPPESADLAEQVIQETTEEKT